MKSILSTILTLLLSILLTACNIGDKTMFFKGKDAQLEKAIETDDPVAVDAAIEYGANPNAVGLHGVTPIIVTSGNLKFNAMKALLKHGANPNVYDKNGDNAVTLAATTYQSDRRYLELLLDNGGDPNSRRPNDDPVITRFGNDRNLDALRYLYSKGADINARSRTGEPLVKDYALSGDWDVVWTLIEIGAKYDYTDPRYSLAIRFKDTVETPPGSPLFEYKEKVWRFLCQNGVEVPPLTTKETWDWYFEDEPRPDVEMPIITCDHANRTVKGDWEDRKPKVKSAYDALKERGEL